MSATLRSFVYCGLAGLVAGVGLAVVVAPRQVLTTPSSDTVVAVDEPEPAKRPLAWTVGYYEGQRDEALALPEGNARKQRYFEMSKAMGDDPILAVDWVKRVTAAMGTQDGLGPAVMRWAQVNPQEAATYLNSFPDTAQQLQYMGIVMSEWAKKDVKSALAFAEACDAGPQSVLLYAVHAGASKLAPAKVIPMYANFRHDPGTNLVFEAAGNSLPLAEAIALARQITEEANRDVFILRSLYTLGEKEPAQALNQLNLAINEDRRNAMGGFIFLKWNERSPTDAKRWLRAQPDGLLKLRCLREATKEDAKHDPDGVVRMLRNLPTGETRNVAIRVFCDEIKPFQPDTAAFWEKQITRSQ